MPRLIDLYDQKPHDRYEVIAFHDESAKSFEALDAKLGPIRRASWRGRDLPFPVFLDATGKTVAAWEIRAFPTAILIDPDGVLMGSCEASQAVESILAGKLKTWAESHPAPETRK